jgi:hypothetical protein
MIRNTRQACKRKTRSIENHPPEEGGTPLGLAETGHEQTAESNPSRSSLSDRDIGGQCATRLLCVPDAHILDRAVQVCMLGAEAGKTAEIHCDASSASHLCFVWSGFHLTSAPFMTACPLPVLLGLVRSCRDFPFFRSDGSASPHRERRQKCLEGTSMTFPLNSRSRNIPRKRRRVLIGRKLLIFEDQGEHNDSPAPEKSRGFHAD